MDTKYYKNKATEEIAEYDSVMGLFYIVGDKKYVPISPLKIVGDPNWEEYTGPVDTEDIPTKTKNKFFNWLGL
jgi:hypothetical protein